MGLKDWLRLSLTDGIGPISIKRLVDAAGGVEGATGGSESLIRSVPGIGAAKARGIVASMRDAKVDEELERADRLGIRILCPDDAEYPPLLKAIPDPPAVLYLKGALQPRDLHAVAIVGSRKCSYYGREQAERFAALLAGVGVSVISGGARGVDSSAHRGAMSHPQGRTIAVLGSGVDVPYPPENDSLFEQIAQRGAVISEYALGTPPLRDNFPRRNRIVSGMSRGVLVVEADERSGALITARQAIEDHGRTVFAIPGRIDNPLSAGPHRLIRDGAVLTESITDILDNLGPMPDHISAPDLFSAIEEEESGSAAAAPVLISPPVDLGLTDRQRLILTHLADPAHVDALVERTALAPNEILQDLTLMSLKGIIKRVEGQTFVRSAAKSRS
ncbi:MAG TPA: DNA-processing protein DprA [Tepidisphaeraceae bacterium]|jgi:DNA processing protein